MKQFMKFLVAAVMLLSTVQMQAIFGFGKKEYRCFECRDNTCNRIVDIQNDKGTSFTVKASSAAEAAPQCKAQFKKNQAKNPGGYRAKIQALNLNNPKDSAMVNP